jgi:flavorubredoxin
VIFVTRYGNTEKVARSLGSGLTEAGVEASCLRSEDVTADSLRSCDLVCAGGPTEWLTASRPMREFISGLEGIDLSGRLGYAFETRLDRPLSGSAAKPIERGLKRVGLRMVATHGSARVFLVDGRTDDAGLVKGEEGRFEQIGVQVGLRMRARLEMAPASGR